MQDKSDLIKLKKLAKDLTILYVDDNKGLQHQALKLLKNFFSKVYTATNGKEGVKLYKENSPDIVITDIKMPDMNGLEMAKKIRDIDYDATIIVASAFDEKEYLLDAIEICISKYLKKPIAVDELVKTLINIIEKKEKEQNIKIFDKYSSDMFEYQDLILVLLENDEVLTINKKGMEFFNVESIEEFKKLFKNFRTLFLKYKDFLSDDPKWLETIKNNEGKLFSIKIKDSEEQNRHFLIKSTKIPKKEDYYMLSLDDVTQLGLVDEDGKELSEEEKHKQIVAILNVIKRNNSPVKLYNYYKGLSITNTGNITEADEKHIMIKTTYLQLRAIHINKSTTIESELFGSYALECQMSTLNFQTQSVELQNCSYIPYLPSEQRYVRVMPEPETKVELRFNSILLDDHVNIIDISLNGCNLSLKTIPAGLKEGSVVLFSAELADKDMLVKLVNIKSQVLKIREEEKDFKMVVKFEIQQEQKKKLTNYIAKRQMALIREFKGLEYAK